MGCKGKEGVSGEGWKGMGEAGEWRKGGEVWEWRKGGGIWVGNEGKESSQD